MDTFDKVPENPINPIFEKLQKRFNELKIKEEEETAKKRDRELSARFEVQMKNFEANLYNSKLYNQSFPLKEILLDASYEVNEGLEEYIYMTYFTSKYPYSVVKSEKLDGTRKTIKVILMDEDRDTFLGKYGIKIEERQVPEFYFIKLK
jgi:hypothetical protein